MTSEDVKLVITQDECGVCALNTNRSRFLQVDGAKKTTVLVTVTFKDTSDPKTDDSARDFIVENQEVITGSAENVTGGSASGITFCTLAPMQAPTGTPSTNPYFCSLEPTAAPTNEPTKEPTVAPTNEPTKSKKSKKGKATEGSKDGSKDNKKPKDNKKTKTEKRM